MSRERIAVVGGGVAGLATAYFLSKQKPDAELLLFEARETAGGNIKTVERDGCVVELGPDALLAHPAAAMALCAELGIASELEEPGPLGRRALIAWRGSLVPMPEGLALGMPRNPMQLARTKLLTPWGKLRALGDLVLPARSEGPISVGALVSRRFGREVSERLVAPLLGGIYGGDVDKLDAAVVLPQFAAVRGSLLRALARAPRPTGSAFRAPKRGLQTLVKGLSDAIGRDRLRTASRAVGLTRREGSFGVQFEDGTRFEAETVVLAMPPHEALAVAGSLGGEARGGLQGFHSNSSASVVLAFDRARVHLPEASGFLVPRSEGKSVLAVTFVGAKWPGRVSEQVTTLRAVVGGPQGRALLAKSDDEVLEQVRTELRGYLELPEERWSLVERHELASPQPEVGHVERVAAARAAMRRYGGLYLVGAGYDGPGIAGCVRGALAVAAEVSALPRAS